MGTAILVALVGGLGAAAGYAVCLLLSLRRPPAETPGLGAEQLLVRHLLELISSRERHHQSVVDGLLDRIQDPSMPARKALREAADEPPDPDLREVDDIWVQAPESELPFDPDLDPRFGFIPAEAD